MSGFSDKEKELLHRLFSPKSIDKLIRLFPESSESLWSTIYDKILHFQASESEQGNGIDLVMYIDGASDLEHGRAGIGGIFYRGNKSKHEENELYTFSENIGKATNNEAEYKALIQGLRCAKLLNGRDISIFSDSELMVKQINLKYRVKNKRLQKLYSVTKELLAMFHSWNINHIPRNQNKIADNLSKQGLNNI